MDIIYVLTSDDGGCKINVFALVKKQENTVAVKGEMGLSDPYQKLCRAGLLILI